MRILELEYDLLAFCWCRQHKCPPPCSWGPRRDRWGHTPAEKSSWARTSSAVMETVMMTHDRQDNASPTLHTTTHTRQAHSVVVLVSYYPWIYLWPRISPISPAAAPTRALWSPWCHSPGSPPSPYWNKKYWNCWNIAIWTHITMAVESTIWFHLQFLVIVYK